MTRRAFAFLLVLLIPIAALAQQTPAAKAPAKGALPYKDTTKNASYIMGYSSGMRMGQQWLNPDLEAFKQGLQDALGSVDSKLTPAQAQQIMQEFQQQLDAKLDAAEKRNKVQGDAFLAKNGKAPGVKTLPSGVQYRVIKQGKGKKPGRTDMVTTHYQGTLINGKVFDSSYKVGKPVQFPVNRVIPAWTEALQLMEVGSKWQLFVPAEMGYGKDGSGPKIEPGATLIFEVELLAVDKPPQLPARGGFQPEEIEQ